MRKVSLEGKLYMREEKESIWAFNPTPRPLSYWLCLRFKKSCEHTNTPSKYKGNDRCCPWNLQSSLHSNYLCLYHSTTSPSHKKNTTIHKNKTKTRYFKLPCSGNLQVENNHTQAWSGYTKLSYSRGWQSFSRAHTNFHDENWCSSRSFSTCAKFPREN